MSLRSWAVQPARVMNLIRMCPRRRFVLVEGSTDCRFLKRHISHRIGIEALGNRAEVSETCGTLENAGVDNFIGLIDADFDHVTGVMIGCSRVVYVSLGDSDAESTIDLESTLLRTRALRQVCGEVLGNQIRDFGGPQQFADAIKEALRVAGAAVGAYRAAVMSVFAEHRPIQGIGELSDSEWQAFVDMQTGEVDQLRLDAIMQTRVRNILMFPEIRQRARDSHSSWGAGWLLCRGHDLTRLLALRLSHLRGRIIDATEVEARLLNAYDGRIAVDTAFGRRLQNFCDA